MARSGEDTGAPSNPDTHGPTKGPGGGNLRDDILRPSPTTFADLVEDLAWPRLLRAARLALRPDRLGLAFFAVVLIALVGRLNTSWGDTAPVLDLLASFAGGAVGSIISNLIALNFSGAGSALADLLVVAPGAIVGEAPVGALVLLPALLVLWIIISGSLCRSVALEIGAGIIQPWSVSLGYGLRKLPDLLWSLLVPVIFIAISVLLLVGLGAALLSNGVVSIAGGALWPVFLVLASACAVVGWGVLLGGLMLTPVIAVEGTDAFDAIQRVLHYALHKPLRLVIHLLVLVLMGVLAVGVVQLLVSGAIGVAVTAASSAGLGVSGEVTGVTINPEGTKGAASTGMWLVNLWNGALTLLVSAYALSYICAASTVLYLVQREIHDGQTHTEVWIPDGERRLIGSAAHPYSEAADTDN